MPQPPMRWPASCYPPAITNQYRFLDHAPGPRALRSVLPRYLRPGLDVLDIGCGTGISACHLAASGGKRVAYTGIDPDPAACRQARDVLAGLPSDRIRGRVLETSLARHLTSNPPPADLILWIFAFHDCVDVTDVRAHAPVAAAVAGLLRPGGHLVLMDACFAPGVSPDEVERTYTYMARIVGHCDRGRYFSPEVIPRLFTEARLGLIERHDVPLVFLARHLDLTRARAALFVFVKNDP